MADGIRIAPALIDVSLNSGDKQEVSIDIFNETNSDQLFDIEVRIFPATGNQHSSSRSMIFWYTVGPQLRSQLEDLAMLI